MMLKDQGRVFLLALLDVSAALDTVNHDILIHRVQQNYGITNTAIAWFNSYLHDCNQRSVKSGDSMSDRVILDIGVPKGSDSGPGAYTRYMRNLGALIRELLLLFHLFADDAQLFQSVNQTSVQNQLEVREQMQNGIYEIRT